MVLGLVHICVLIAKIHYILNIWEVIDVGSKFELK